MKEIQREVRRKNATNWIVTPDRFLTPSEVEKLIVTCDDIVDTPDLHGHISYIIKVCNMEVIFYESRSQG